MLRFENDLSSILFDSANFAPNLEQYFPIFEPRTLMTTQFKLHSLKGSNFWTLQQRNTLWKWNFPSIWFLSIQSYCLSVRTVPEGPAVCVLRVNTASNESELWQPASGECWSIPAPLKNEGIIDQISRAKREISTRFSRTLSINSGGGERQMVQERDSTRVKFVVSHLTILFTKISVWIFLIKFAPGFYIYTCVFSRSAG